MHMSHFRRFHSINWLAEIITFVFTWPMELRLWLACKPERNEPAVGNHTRQADLPIVQADGYVSLDTRWMQDCWYYWWW